MDMQKETAIIEFVKKINSGYENQTEPTIKRVFDIGPVKVYVLGFRGQDGRWYENYVTDFRDELRGFEHPEDAIPEISKGFGFSNFVMANFVQFALSIAGILTLLALFFFIYVSGKYEEGVNILVGLMGAILGYIVGKKDAGKP
jgi:hypothetical protein